MCSIGVFYNTLLLRIVMVLDKTRELFITNLRKLRNDAGLSQSKLAESIGISLSGYAKIEYGNSWPTPETLRSIAEALKVPEANLFVDPHMSPPPAPKILTAEDIIRLTHPETADEMELLRLFRSASPALKESVLETVRHLLNPGHNK